MCGIVAYLGNNDAYPIILNGLKRLEYRGYDSAGICLYNGSKLQTKKTKGKIQSTSDLTKTKVTTTKDGMSVLRTMAGDQSTTRFSHLLIKLK